MTKIRKYRVYLPDGSYVIVEAENFKYDCGSILFRITDEEDSSIWRTVTYFNINNILGFKELDYGNSGREDS